MPQTSYPNAPAIGLDGSIAEGTGYEQIDSFEASEAIAFGLGVMRNATNDYQIDRADSASGEFLGVAMRSNLVENDGVAGGFVSNDMVPVLSRGRIFVRVGAAVTAGSTAYVIVASTNQSEFTSVATSNLATGGKFISDAASGGLAILELA